MNNITTYTRSNGETLNIIDMNDYHLANAIKKMGRETGCRYRGKISGDMSPPIDPTYYALFREAAWRGLDIDNPDAFSETRMDQLLKDFNDFLDNFKFSYKAKN